MSRKKVVYFDNNGTTFTAAPVINVFNKWLSCYNPSSSSQYAQSAKSTIDKTKNDILAHCGVSSATHTVVFNSGASEGNNFIIRSCVKAYRKKAIEAKSNVLPHVIVSAMEHNSSIECVNDLVDHKYITASFIQPTIYGNILPESVEREIRPNTCLISVMYANNEVPIINNIHDISKIAHRNNIPIHTDAVQVFGKYKINMKKDDIDVLTFSGHKFYAPKGVGGVIINNELLEGYHLSAEISGTQQGGLRGGTENVPGIISLGAALKLAFNKRKEKNTKLLSLRNRLLEKLKKIYTFVDYVDYLEEKQHQNLELVSLGPPETETSFILPNTILLSVCKNTGVPFCNIDLKNYLDKKGFIVSVGSACNTASPKASHVLTALGAPPVIKRGVIRVSFGDSNSTQEVDAFVKVFVEGVAAQCKDIHI